MKKLIEEIIDRFGGRAAGSDAETRAQEYINTVFAAFCDTTEIQQFEIRPKAKFGSLKYFVGFALLALALYWVSPFFAFIIGLLNSILYLGHFVTYQNWLDGLFRKATSRNVIGTIEPKEKVHSTIIISGHMDSAMEFKWWWKLKNPGVILTVVAGFIIALIIPAFLTVGFFSATAEHGGYLGAWLPTIWIIILLISPTTITLADIHGDKPVPGAQDNLSGITIATAVGRHFATARLKRTRIKVISFGSEEIGLRGSEAYAKTYAAHLKQANTVCLNLDGVKDAEHLTIVTKEPMVLTKYSPALIIEMESAFKAVNTKYKKIALPIGATDGASLQRNGIPALTILGQRTDKVDPTYHTRLDVPQFVEEKALEDVATVLKQFIINRDKSVG